MRRGCKPHRTLSDRYTFEDAAGRPPGGEYLHTISVFCLNGSELTGCHRRRSFNRLSTRRTRCRKNAPQNILNRVGSGNIKPMEDFRSVFVRNP
jgi:hypothetical protein